MKFDDEIMNVKVIWFLIVFYCNRGWKKFRTFIASTFGIGPSSSTVEKMSQNKIPQNCLCICIAHQLSHWLDDSYNYATPPRWHLQNAWLEKQCASFVPEVWVSCRGWWGESCYYVIIYQYILYIMLYYII